MLRRRRKEKSSLSKDHKKDKKKGGILKSELESESEALCDKFLSDSKFQHDIRKLNNFQNHSRIWNSIQNQELIFLSSQLGVEIFRQSMPPWITHLHSIFLLTYGRSAIKSFLSYSKIHTASHNIRTGINLLCNPPFTSSHIKKISDNIQPFSENVKFHEIPKYLSYIPISLGIIHLILSSKFLQLFQEELSQSPYAFHGASYVVISEALGYIISYLMTKLVPSLRKVDAPNFLTEKELLLFDPLERTLGRLKGSHSTIIISGVLCFLSSLLLQYFTFLTPGLEALKSELHSEDYGLSSITKKLNWTFGLNIIIALLINLFNDSVILSPQFSIRRSFVKDFSHLLNESFDRIIFSRIVTKHDLIQIESLTKDIATQRFFSLAITMCCEASITGECDNQFLLIMEKRFDPTVAIEKIKYRFKIHTQLAKYSQGVNWQKLDKNYDEKSSGIEFTFTPFKRKDTSKPIDSDELCKLDQENLSNLSWSIEIEQLDETDQERLKENLTSLYSKDNKNLEITIQNGELMIHGLETLCTQNKMNYYLKILNNPETQEKKSSAPQKSPYSFSFNPHRIDFDSHKTVRTGKQTSHLKKDEKSKPKQDLTIKQKWDEIIEQAKLLCKQAREKLTSNPELELKGGDPEKDAFFALVNVQNGCPKNITRIVWAQNLTSDSIKGIENSGHETYFKNLLTDSKERGCVELVTGKKHGICKIDQRGFSHKLRLSQGVRCGIATITDDSFRLTLPSSDDSNHNISVKLAIMNTEQCFSHDQFDHQHAPQISLAR